MNGIRGIGWMLFAFAVTATSLWGQSAREMEDEYRLRVRRADNDSATAFDYLGAAEASRFMRRWGDGAFYLKRAEVAARHPSELNGALREELNYLLATGVPLSDMKATFAAAREEWNIPVIVVAGWVNAFPELLVGGEYDVLIEGLSADAADDEHRCACYAPKAWMHRVAGRMEQSRVYWDSLNYSSAEMPDVSGSFDEAEWRAQRARNLARAGRYDESREELAEAMKVNVTAFESVSILRRRAQTFAEMGEVESAVADLEALLQAPSPVTVHTIRSRVTWEPIRNHPAFQELLRRHPTP
ncbi:MAG: tetratricopeptide (TPR) repeat protein [Myxococcota bacterium]|jgi:tetratricopeptide (TPR) repeat protein